jgi:hypothetical protein
MAITTDSATSRASNEPLRFSMHPIQRRKHAVPAKFR